jgi:hypothetical protein
MNSLLFICPRSRQPIDSGISLDLSAFRQTKAVGLRVRCPHCGVSHATTVGQGFVSEVLPDDLNVAA